MLHIIPLLFMIVSCFLMALSEPLKGQVIYEEMDLEQEFRDGMLSYLPTAGSIEKGNSAVSFNQYDRQLNLLKTIELDPSIVNDPSFAILPRVHGGYSLRYNISIFEQFDAQGRSLGSVSNSSGSTLGESVSEWYTNDDQSLWVVTNPIIKTNEGQGSAASIWDLEKTTNLFYSTKDRLVDVDISNNALFIALISMPSTESGKGQLKIVDRQANELMLLEIDADFDPIGVEFASNNEYITLFSSRRAQVYGLPSGKLYGSTSFRNTLIDVELDPSTLKLYSLTGALDDNQLSKGVIRMVDFKARKTDKSDGFISLERLDKTIPVQLISESNEIKTRGLKKVLQIK